MFLENKIFKVDLSDREEDGMSKHGEVQLKHIEALLNMIGGEDALNDLVSQRSRLIEVRNHNFLKEVWDRYGKDLEKLGAKRLFDPWEQPHRKVIRDIVLPFKVKYNTIGALEIIENWCRGQFRFTVAKSIREYLGGGRSECIEESDFYVSSFFTMQLFNNRQEFLRANPSTPRPYQFWSNSLYFPDGTTGKIHNNMIDLGQVLNFYIKYLHIWIEDAKQKKPILPTISASYYKYNSSFAAGLIVAKGKKEKISIKFDSWDTENGFDQYRSPGVLVNENYMKI